MLFFILLALGTWQVQRLHWKEGLLQTIDRRTHSAPQPLAEVERQFAATGDVDYTPVTVTGTFLHQGERHFFATWEGASGFDVYTPLQLEDGRFVLVNRGFVPYDLKDAIKRPQGQVAGKLTVTGLARNPLLAKPSMMLPDNDLSKNIFYWKDRDAMASSAGLPAGAGLVPFLIDAERRAEPRRAAGRRRHHHRPAEQSSAIRCHLVWPRGGTGRDSHHQAAPPGKTRMILQRRASCRTRKGRCNTLVWRMILSENRFRFSGSCAAALDRVGVRTSFRLSSTDPESCLKPPPSHR